MEFSFEIVVFAIAVVVLNVVDSVTTRLCFKQYPDKELKGEANPIMRWLMLRSKVLAEMVKQSAILLGVSFALWNYSMVGLRLASIMFAFVVLNNSYIYISRRVTKRKTASPIKKLAKLLRLPDKYVYGWAMCIVILLSLCVYKLVW